MRVVCVCEIEMKGLLRGALRSPRTSRPCEEREEFFLFCHLVCLIEEEEIGEEAEGEKKSSIGTSIEAYERMLFCFFSFFLFCCCVLLHTHSLANTSFFIYLF